MTYVTAAMLSKRLQKQWNEVNTEVRQAIMETGMERNFLINANDVPRDPETMMPDPKYFVGSHTEVGNQMYYTLTSLGYTLFVWAFAEAKRSTKA